MNSRREIPKKEFLKNLREKSPTEIVKKLHDKCFKNLLDSRGIVENYQKISQWGFLKKSPR